MVQRLIGRGEGTARRCQAGGAACVTDPSHPQYGDHHIPFGPPGVIDTAEIGQIMARAREMGYLCPEKRPPLFCEVLKKDGEEPKNVIRHVRNALESGWDNALKRETTAI